MRSEHFFSYPQHQDMLANVIAGRLHMNRDPTHGIPLQYFGQVANTFPQNGSLDNNHPDLLGTASKKMLSTSNSAIDKRRTLHRRQNSTPITEMPHIAPATTGFQRANNTRGHRRGLSLDHRSTTYEPTHRMTPTLRPIAQDDISVSISNPGQMTQQMQFAQTQELVQPGQSDQFNPMHPQFQIQPLFSPSDLDHSCFPASPFSQHLSPSPRSLQAPTFQSPNMHSVDQTQARLQQFESAKRELEAHLGAQINIQVLPTPVATPRKRTSVIALEKLDVAPITFNLHDSSLEHQQLDSFDLNPVEHMHIKSAYGSPILSPKAVSPHRSFLGSPQFAALSPQTSLAEIDEDYPSGAGSPVNPISFADLSLQEWNGSIVETGVPSEEVEKLISQQDPETRQYYCLVEGCNKGGGFNRRENIRAHVQTHLGDRAFRCNVCDQCFVRQNDLKRHHSIHKSMKPFSCECGSRFARHDALTRHKQRGCCTVHTSPLKPERKKPGRPKKHRPELNDRLSKATRQRQLNADRYAYDSQPGSNSDSEFSPSPRMHRTEFTGLDATSFGDVVLASSPPSEGEDSPSLGAMRDGMDTINGIDLK